MAWNNPTGYPFTHDGIIRNAPNASGVYALFTQQRWVYIGESNDIQRRLLEHLNAPGPCISQYAPLSFSFELAPAAQRVARQNVLIQELRPACNQILG